LLNDLFFVVSLVKGKTIKISRFFN